jgi:protein-disulfide isomerase
VLLAVGIVLVLAVAGIGLGVALAGNSDSSLGKVPAHGSLTGKLALPAAKQVDTMLAGIPQRGNVLGSPSAPVTLVEYVDLQCPYCDQFELNVAPNLISQYVRTGKVKIETRPLAFIGPDSVRGRSALIAAGQQNRFYNFMELLYADQGTENTGWLSDRTVERAAASIPGLDVPRLLSDREAAGVSSLSKTYDRLATDAGVHRTPTIAVGKTGGTLREVAMSSPTDAASIVAAINAAQ